jgi:hypothetical protein
MLTETMERVLRIFPYLDPQTQQGFLDLLREYGPRLAAAEGQSPVPRSAVDDLVRAVPDDLVRDIVKDLGKGVAPPSGLTKEGPRPPVKRGSGWQTPREAYRSPHESAVFDELVSHFVGGPNDPVK